MIVRDREGKYVGINCDSPGCPTKAPSSDEILAGRGLNNMGWNCAGGVHLCPEHAGPRIERPKLPPLSRSRHE